MLARGTHHFISQQRDDRGLFATVIHHNYECYCKDTPTSLTRDNGADRGESVKILGCNCLVRAYELAYQYHWGFSLLRHHGFNEYLLHPHRKHSAEQARGAIASDSCFPPFHISTSRLPYLPYTSSLTVEVKYQIISGDCLIKKTFER